MVFAPIFSFGVMAADGPSPNIDSGPEGGGFTAEEASEIEITADSVSGCGSIDEKVAGKKTYFLPRNCMYLDEPIGGQEGHDLFIVDCKENKEKTAVGCSYTTWYGGSVKPYQYGPVQAVLTFDPSKPYYGHMALLYNYMGLAYNYLSGIIVGVSVLFVVVGGIQITLYGASQESVNAGKSRIIKAVVGLILWFTASLILYTINPTFFAF